MVKISELQIENVKKVKAVAFEPQENGLTIIGGRNGQGKTSVLDAIAWTLGGNKYKPSNPHREGSVVPPELHIKLTNGLLVERTGVNSTLKITDPDGNKGGQQLLDSFVEQFAIDLPRFMNQTNKEKAATLLKIIGVGDQLYKLEDEEQRLYNQRHAIGQIADQKEKFAKEMPLYSNVPTEIVSAAELIKKQQNILAVNGENQRKREQAEKYRREVSELNEKISELNIKLAEATANLETAQKSAENLTDESTAEIEQSIESIEETNRKVRANLDREKAEIDAEDYRRQYEELSLQIDNIRKAKTALLESKELPLENLSVQDGELIYNGFKWDNMSASEQLKVSTAIVRKLNPNCGFVLLDKLEQMDTDTLREFGEWLEKEGLQAIATRVSIGGECSIIIEDGGVRAEEKQKAWKEGEF